MELTEDQKKMYDAIPEEEKAVLRMKVEGGIGMEKDAYKSMVILRFPHLNIDKIPNITLPEIAKAVELFVGEPGIKLSPSQKVVRQWTKKILRELNTKGFYNEE